MAEEQVRLCGETGTGVPYSSRLEPERSKQALGAAGQLTCFQKGKILEVFFFLIFLPID